MLATFLRFSILLAYGDCSFADLRATDARNLADLIVDTTTTLFPPTRITAFLCIDEASLVDLSVAMSRRGVMHDLRTSFDDFASTAPSDDSHQTVYVLDLDCLFAAEVLRKANAEDMFGSPAKWLLLRDFDTAGDPVEGPATDCRASATNDTQFHIDFDELDVLPDSELIIARRLRDDIVELTSIYRTVRGRQLIREIRGYWEARRGVISCSGDSTSWRRKDLQLTPLKSCLVISIQITDRDILQKYNAICSRHSIADRFLLQITNPDSLNHLMDLHDKTVDTITKTNYPWIVYLGEMVNASFTFVHRPSWGYRSENGTWNGMMKLLVDGEIEIGGTTMFPTQERRDVVQFINLYTATMGRFVFRRPPLSYVRNIFTLPFRSSVWISSGTLVLLITVMLYLALKWEWETTTDEEMKQSYWNGPLYKPSWGDNLLIIVGSVFQQGFTYEPRTVPSRIIILSFFVAIISLYTSYSANIVVLLQSTTTSITTRKDLIESPLKVGVLDTVYFRHYFKSVKDPPRKSFYEQKIEPRGKKPAFMSLEEGISRLRQGLFAFYFELSPGYDQIQKTFREDEKCGFVEINYLNEITYPLLAVRRRSPYFEIFKVMAYRIQETGLRNRMMDRMYTKKPTCHGSFGFVTVSLTESYAAFTSLAYGMALSVVLLMLEKLWHKRCSVISEEAFEGGEFVE